MITKLPSPCDGLHEDAVCQYVEPTIVKVDRLANKMLQTMLELTQDLGDYADLEHKTRIKTMLYDRLIKQLHEDSEELTRNPNYYTTYKGA